MKNLFTLLAIAICTLSVVEMSAQNYYYAVTVGDTVQLSVTNANGTIQWQQTDDTLGTWSNISGATTSPYLHLTQSSATGKKFYRAEITNPTVCTTGSWYSSIIKHKIISNLTELQIGDFYGGGFVFYNNAGSGLIAAPSDQGTGSTWGCNGTLITGADGFAIGTGEQNTLDIVAGCATAGNAAQLCFDLVLDGYYDWFLPSKDELNLLYTNLHLNSIGGFSSYGYWSSSEVSAGGAWLQDFSNGTQSGGTKTYVIYVRGIRAFSPPPPLNCGTVTDYDGNIYNTVTIGSQCWLKENLKTTKYADGTPLVDGTGAGDITGNYTTKYYFDYADNPANTVTYGKLYTWAAIMNDAASSNGNPSGVQGACPTGWHVPSDAEWNIMEKYLDSTVDTIAIGWVGTDIGGILKETGTTHWNSPNTGATDSSGFTALPGGYRYSDGSFGDVGNYGYWWSATVNYASYAWERFLYYSYATVYRYDYGKAYGFSVRCVKD